MKYKLWITLLTTVCLALLVTGFWVSYPVWWKGMKGPNYEFLTGLLGNAVISVLDIVVVTFCVGTILRRRDDMRWKYSRSRFSQKFLQKLRTVLICTRDRIATEVQKEGVRERLSPDVRKVLEFHFKTVSAETLSTTMNDSLASMESLIDAYAPALTAESIDFSLHLTAKVEELQSLSARIGFGSSRAADAESFCVGVLEPSRLLLATIVSTEAFVDEDLPAGLEREFGGFAAIHTRILTTFVADIEKGLVSISEGSPLDAPQLRTDFQPLFKK